MSFCCFSKHIEKSFFSTCAFLPASCWLSGSGVAGRGGGSRGPDPPELPSGVHAKRKNPLRIFFVERGVGGYTAADDELARTPPEPLNPPTPLLSGVVAKAETFRSCFCETVKSCSQVQCFTHVRCLKTASLGYIATYWIWKKQNMKIKSNLIRHILLRNNNRKRMIIQCRQKSTKKQTK